MTGILTDKNEVKRNFRIECFEEKCFNAWEYDLRMGNEYYIASNELPNKLEENEMLVISPGEFALLITEEYLNLELDVMAFITIRFGLKKKGLINVSGFHVDPGYEGNLMFSVFNAGPNDIVIRRKEPIFMIFFQRLPQEIEKKTRSPIEFVSSNDVESIKGKSITLTKNADRLEKLEFHFKVITWLVALLTTGAIGAIVKKLFFE
ncbi:MAG: hypothetical protein HPY50_20220 [Firmicutes bacterium]|nr:hypothetical protein [Bacillota bacterium]